MGCIWLRSSCFQTHRGLPHCKPRAGARKQTRVHYCLSSGRGAFPGARRRCDERSMLLVSSGLSQEEGGGRAGHQRPGHGMPAPRKVFGRGCFPSTAGHSAPESV